MLTAIALAGAMVAQTIPYQQLAFRNDPNAEPPTGQMTPAETQCVADVLPAIHPGELPGDLLRVLYARNDAVRSEACVTFTVARTATTEAVAAMDSEPKGLTFSEDGATAYYRESLGAQCRPRGQYAGLVGCLSRFFPIAGLATNLLVERPTVSDPLLLQYAWEQVTGPPSSWAVLRAQNKAKPVQTEVEPPPEEGGP